MKLWVNGEAREVPADITLAELLADLKISTDQVAVELNQAVVRRAEHPVRRLAEGDRVEIVTFVGGG